MDKGVIDLVRYFNSIGLKTYMSCEGHWPERPNMAHFWISFDKEVSDESIMAFKDAHCNLNGWFVKMYINRIAGLEWRYFAANKEVAALDYKYFISLD